jgi:hypothetical protein
MAVFERSEAPIALTVRRGTNAVFVLGSAVPHGHDLHLGYYSVHTSRANRGAQSRARPGADQAGCVRVLSSSACPRVGRYRPKFNSKSLGTP